MNIQAQMKAILSKGNQQSVLEEEHIGMELASPSIPHLSEKRERLSFCKEKTELDRLHATAHRRYPRTKEGFEQMQQSWNAYSAFAKKLSAQLPFRWHPVGCDNPTQNHTGVTNGTDHIVLDENIRYGRLHRLPGDALCRSTHGTGWGGNLWVSSSAPTCKRCLQIAERIVSSLEEKQKDERKRGSEF